MNSISFIRKYDNQQLTITKIGSRYQLDNLPVFYSQDAVDLCFKHGNWVKV